MRTLIQGGTLVNEGKLFEGSILIEDSRIARIYTEPHTPEASYDELIDASGCFILPGVIDCLVSSTIMCISVSLV